VVKSRETPGRLLRNGTSPSRVRGKPGWEKDLVPAGLKPNFHGMENCESQSFRLPVGGEGAFFGRYRTKVKGEKGKKKGRGTIVPFR